MAITLARAPIGINALAYVLAIRHETGSFAAAGAASGAYALTLGLSSPIQGRLMDRLSPARVVPPLIAFHVLMLGLFVGLLGHVPAWALAVLAGLSGLGLPPWSSLMRAMWPRLLGDESLVTTAFALDSTIVELVFIVGPLLVAVSVAVASAQAALIGSAVLAVVGTARLVTHPAVRAWRPEARAGRSPFGALASRGLLTVFLATIPAGFGFGATEIAMPAFAASHGHAHDAGLLIAVWALGSATGGLLYGARDWGRPLAERWLLFAGLLGFGLLAPLAASSIGVVLVLLIPAGLFIAPTIASGSQLMGVLAPPGMTAEAYAWGPTAIVMGSSAGAAVAGALAQTSGWRAAALAAGVAALCGAAIGLARRRTLSL